MLGWTLLVDLGLLLALFVLLRWRRGRWALFALAIVPVVLTYVLNENLRVYSSHGFMHGTMVYEILQGHIPPENTLFSGHPWLYAWAHHGLCALLVWATGLDPWTIFAALNVLALVATVAFLYGAAGRAGFSSTAAILAVFLALYAVTCFNRGPLATLVNRLQRPAFAASMEPRGTPPVEKFMNVNTMPLGEAGYGLFLCGLVTSVCLPERRRAAMGMLFLATLWVGYFYPVVLLGIVGATVAAGAALLLTKRMSLVAVATRIVLPVFLAGVLAAPYLYWISHGKQSAAQLAATTERHLLLVGIYRCAMTLGPLLLLLVWERATLRQQFRREPALYTVLAAVVVVTAWMFVGVHGPTEMHYKFLMLSGITLGFLAAPCFEHLWQSHPKSTLAAAFLLLLPLSDNLVQRFQIEKQSFVSAPFRIEGRYLVHRDPAEQALYDWIRKETPADAIFLDTQRTIPIFAQRRMYVGIDEVLKAPPGMIPADGWFNTTDCLLSLVNGYPAEEIARRRQMAEDVLAEGGLQLGDGTWAELRRAATSGTVYVVARSEGQRRKCGGDSHFAQRFANTRAAVFEFQP